MAPKPHTYGDEDEEPEANYHESSDEDFNPDDAPADDAADSSEDEDTAPATSKGKRRAPVDDELDSGDEVTIQAARKKGKKRKKGSKDDDDHLVLSEDEGGDGGLIRTRAQRAVEKTERRQLASIEGATVDVEALWAQMVSAPLRPVQPAPVQEAPSQEAAPAVTQTNEAPIEEELLTVTKTFVFAGQNTTEEKQVPRSALGKYTADGWKPTTAVKPTEGAEGTTPKDTGSQTRRPLRRPSRFDPNPTGYVRALAPEHQLTWPRKNIAPAAPPPETTVDGLKKPEKATKLNVVDKSRMDWTGFVDKEGIAEELQEHGKSKDNYMSRRDFLAGVEARREEEGRKGRVANATALT
ncbi:swr complex subunit [Didymella sp. IMI 355093]|nr:swr complex subunit [Didymella sp. IMI 355093]